MILFLILSTISMAGYNAKDAAIVANKKNRMSISNKKIYSKIKEAAKAGEYSVSIDKMCSSIEFLKIDGYELYEPYNAGCAPYPPHTCTCNVSWSPVVNK